MFPCHNWGVIYYVQRRYMALERRYLRDYENPFEMPEERFREMYRFPPRLALNFIEEIEVFMPMDNYENDRKIPLHLEVLTLFNFMASGSYQRRVGRDSDASMSQTMVSRIINKIARVITNNLAPKYVTFPENQAVAQVIKNKFRAETELPGIVGIVDGTHVCLTNLHSDQEDVYVNRKGDHSLNVQIICDSDLRILNVNARYPGSCHDSHVFESSMVLNTLQRLHREDSTTWILGDSAYALRNYLITPFRNPTTDYEILFNKIHCSIRNTVERCIGVLKGRWRSLLKARELHYGHEAAAHIIYAACVCHNYLIEYNIPFEEDNEIIQLIRNEDIHRVNNDNDSLANGRNFLVNFIRENNVNNQ